MDSSLTSKTLIARNNSTSPQKILENLSSKPTLYPIDSFQRANKLNSLSINNNNNDSLSKPLSLQTKHQAFHSSNNTNTNPLMFRQLPQIKNQKILVQPLNDHSLQERSNNIHIDKAKSFDKKALINSTSPPQFLQFHNRNLEMLKQAKQRYLQIHPNKEKTEESPMERLNKIKKFFNLDFTTIPSNEDYNAKRHIAISLTTIPVLDNKIYYYNISRGNNSELIQTCMKTRLRWKDSNSIQPNLHLIWTPTSYTINYSLMTSETDPSKVQMANHFEGHPSISNKLKMFENIMKYCENHNLDIFTYLPMTILMQYESSNFISQFHKFEQLFNHISEFINPNTMKLKYKDYFTLDSQNEKLGTKSSLYIHKNHYSERNLWLIKAINLNRGRCIKIADSVQRIEEIIKHFYQGMLKSFKQNQKEEEELIKNGTSSLLRNVLVLPKIITSINKGDNDMNKKGKQKTRKTNNIENGNAANTFVKVDYSVINSRQLNMNKYQSSMVILQKYIEKPLLYYGRKFDVRIWVLLTHKMEVYVFKEGHLKATSVKYDVLSKNSYVHLTNYSVQKYNENFSKFEYGNEISFEDFENYLLNEQGIKMDVKKELLPKIYDIIKISMLSVKDLINANTKKYCFEIFGYDFMFDCDFNPYLIEINTNPGLEISSPLISVLVPRMIDDALRLTIDTLFVTEYSWNSDSNSNLYKSQFPVSKYEDYENLWELICDLNKNDCTVRGRK